MELTTRVSGVIESVLVRPRQKVKKGEELLRLDNEIFNARVDEAAAELDGFRADEAEARRELDRAQELYSRTVSSTTELDAAKLRHFSANSALRADKARFIVANTSLADSELRVPFAGVVSEVPAAPGVVVVAECQPRTLVVLSRRS